MSLYLPDLERQLRDAIRAQTQPADSSRSAVRHRTATVVALGGSVAVAIAVVLIVLTVGGPIAANRPEDDVNPSPPRPLRLLFRVSAGPRTQRWDIGQRPGAIQAPARAHASGRVWSEPPGPDLIH